MYIRNSFKVVRLCTVTTCWSGKPGFPEYLFCEVHAPSSPPIFVGVVYLPPHATFIAHSEFIPHFTWYIHNYSTKVILGDFNADLLSDSADAKFIRGLIEEYLLYALPYGATYHTNTSDT